MNGMDTPINNFKNIKESAKGRWKDELLPYFGIGSDFLSGKHCSCPSCGGKDRFRFDNKDGHGSYYCNRCKPGDGFNLIAKTKGLTSEEALTQVAQYLDMSATKNQKMLARKKSTQNQTQNTKEPSQIVEHLNALLNQCEYETHPYLLAKNINKDVLVNKKTYRVSGSNQRVHVGALIVPLYDLTSDQLVSVQFINADKSRGFIAGSIVNNAIHLLKGREHERATFIGIAEGYADAVVCSLVTGGDVFMACSAKGIESKVQAVQNLDSNKRLVIFADNDEAGLKSAKIAEERTGGLIIAPPGEYKDWADVYKEKGLIATQEILLK